MFAIVETQHDVKVMQWPLVPYILIALLSVCIMKSQRFPFKVNLSNVNLKSMYSLTLSP